MLPLKDTTKRRTFPAVNILFIVINGVAFFWSLSDFREIILAYGFIPAEWSVVTVLTSMFLHGGLDHLFGNMWYLWIFGDNVEDRLGHARYLMFYLAAGVAASFINYATDPFSRIPGIGASGAISGVLGAYLLFYPKSRVLVLIRFYLTTVPTYAMILFWFVLQLIFGSVSLLGGVGDGIAYWAHIGGFLFGLVVGYVARTALAGQR